MPQDHYFSANPAAPAAVRTIRVRLAGRELEVLTAPGVFSPDHVDAGTAILLDEAPPPAPRGDLLDLGCGWGPIALSLALASPAATVWAVDVNERALDLLRRNADRHHLANLNAVTAEDVPEGVQFAQIWSNPPIRVGKVVLHELLLTWLPRLAPGGTAWLVVQKHLGSDSLQRWLGESLPDGFSVTRAASEKGFRVLRVDRD